MEGKRNRRPGFVRQAEKKEDTGKLPIRYVLGRGAPEAGAEHKIPRRKTRSGRKVTRLLPQSLPLRKLPAHADPHADGQRCPRNVKIFCRAPVEKIPGTRRFPCGRAKVSAGFKNFLSENPPEKKIRQQGPFPEFPAKGQRADVLPTCLTPACRISFRPQPPATGWSSLVPEPPKQDGKTSCPERLRANA